MFEPSRLSGYTSADRGPRLQSDSPNQAWTPTNNSQTLPSSRTPSHQIENISVLSESSPCKVCNSEVDDPFCIACDSCDFWLHFKCSGLKKSEYDFLTADNLPSCVKYLCPLCLQTPLQSIDFNAQNLRLDKQDVAIKTLSETVKTLQTQNENILNILKGPSLENKLQTQMDEVLENQREKEEKRNNVILFNVPEATNREPIEGVKDDTDLVKEILTHVSPDLNFVSLNTASVSRLGALREGNTKPRPIKVTLTGSDQKFKLLKSSRKLKEYQRFSRIGLSKDKTKKEILQDRILKTELERVKRTDENADPVVFRGKIVERQIRNEILDRERTEVNLSGAAWTGASHSDAGPY